MIYLHRKCSSVVKVRHDLFYSQRKGRVLKAAFVDDNENTHPGPVGTHTEIEIISTTATCLAHSHLAGEVCFN